MKQIREILLGLLASLATTLIVLGALSISITEGMVFVPTLALTEARDGLDIDLTTLLPVQTRTPAATTAERIITATSPALPACAFPKKWQPYTLEIGDTLKQLARQFGLSPQELKDGNCLLSDELVPGTVIYIPPQAPTAPQKASQTVQPTRTLTPAPSSRPWACEIPLGWIPYRIQAGENLFRIGLRYNITAEELRRVNCLASSDQILAGALIYVPNVPTIMPTLTRTVPEPAVTRKPPTAIPSSTATLLIPTSTPTNTPTPSLAPTFTLTPLDTPTETAELPLTETPIPTETTPAP